jgi:glycosyltransferase involved in cell wall biosynthesis
MLKVSPISVLPLVSMKKGSYPNILYSTLQKKYKIEILHPQVIGLGKCLTQMITKRPIVHIHWIEHKYTFGFSRTKFLAPIMFFGIVFYLITLLFLRVLRFKMVVTLHNILPHKPILLSIEKAIFKITLNLSEAIYVHSHYLKEIASKIYSIDRSKTIVIPHGKLPMITAINFDQKTARKLLNIPEKAFVICFVGRLSEDKGIHILLDALELMKKSDSNDLYVIIAGKPASTRLLKYIKVKIRTLSTRFKFKFYPCYVSDKMLSIVLKACDVGVIPYICTYTPSTLITFMLHGIPVITSDFPVIKAFFRKVGVNDYELLCKPIPKNVQEKIFLVLQNKDKFQKYWEKLSKEVSEEFDWEKCAELTYISYLKIHDLRIGKDFNMNT